MAKRIAQTHRIFGHFLTLHEHRESPFGDASTVWLGRWIDRAMPDEPAHWSALLRRQQRKIGNRTVITWHLSLTGSNASHESGDDWMKVYVEVSAPKLARVRERAVEQLKRAMVAATLLEAEAR